MDTEKINIKGILFDNVDLGEAVGCCIDFLESDKCSSVYTPNAEIAQLCTENREFLEIINSADLVIPDGAGVILASKILKTPLKKGKVAGIELFESMISYCGIKGKKVFLLGGKPGIANAAKENLEKKYPGLNICGVNDGYFEKEGKESDEVIKKINSLSPDLIGVCMGVPVQEIWIKNNKDKLNAKLIGGFGGSLDIFAGVSKRAPKIFIDLRLEWLYRLFKEPKRIGRMMNIPKFIFGIKK